MFLIFRRLFKGSVYKENREFLAGVLGGIFYTKPGSAILPSCKKDRLRFHETILPFFSSQHKRKNSSNSWYKNERIPGLLCANIIHFCTTVQVFYAV